MKRGGEYIYTQNQSVNERTKEAGDPSGFVGSQIPFSPQDNRSLGTDPRSPEAHHTNERRGGANTEIMTPTMFASSWGGSVGVFTGMGHCFLTSWHGTLPGAEEIRREFEIPSKC